MIELILPFPPSVNHYYEPNRGGYGKRIGKRGRDYRADVESIIRANGVSEIQCPVRMTVTLQRPDRHMFDVDNVCKCLLDAISSRPQDRFVGALANDNLIHSLTLTKRPAVKGGQCTVEIWQLDGVDVYGEPVKA